MQRQTLQRTAIETVFAEAGRPLAPREILAGAQHRVPSLNLATVYRTLKRLVADRTIAPVALPGETPRYELRAAADRHHHHFRCARCEWKLLIRRDGRLKVSIRGGSRGSSWVMSCTEWVTVRHPFGVAQPHVM